MYVYKQTNKLLIFTKRGQSALQITILIMLSNDLKKKIIVCHLLIILIREKR